VILTLARDMGVNAAGIEIILNMREKLIEMERQMGEFGPGVAVRNCREWLLLMSRRTRRDMRLCVRRQRGVR